MKILTDIVGKWGRNWLVNNKRYIEDIFFFPNIMNMSYLSTYVQSWCVEWCLLFFCSCPLAFPENIRLASAFTKIHELERQPAESSIVNFRRSSGVGAWRMLKRAICICFWNWQKPDILHFRIPEKSKAILHNPVARIWSTSLFQRWVEFWINLSCNFTQKLIYLRLCTIDILGGNCWSSREREKRI